MDATKFLTNGFGEDVEKIHKNHTIALMENYAEYKLNGFMNWYLNLSIEELNWYEDKYVYVFLNLKE